MRHRLLGLLLVLLMVAAGCGGDDGGADPAQDAGDGAEPAEDAGAGEDEDAAAGDPAGEAVTIRMGWGIPAEEIKYVMQSTPEVAPNLGTCYDIEWNQFAGTALGVQGLAAGTLDGATVGGLSVANGLEQGADIVITGEFIEERPPYFTTGWMVAADSGIETVADLAGRTVATSAIGGSTDYLQDFYIEDQAGLVPGEDYEKVEIPFAQQQEALATGQIDMGLFPQPFYQALLESGDYVRLFSTEDVIEPFVQLLQGFRRDFIEENPEAVRCFVEDFSTVADYVNDPENRDAVIAATNEATGIPVEVLEGFLLTEDDFFRPEGGAVDIEALQEEWDFFREQGGITQDLRVEDHIIEEYLSG